VTRRVDAPRPTPRDAAVPRHQGAHPQTILFFRMGDFYEMFEDDAKLAARELA